MGFGGRGIYVSKGGWGLTTHAGDTVGIALKNSTWGRYMARSFNSAIVKNQWYHFGIVVDRANNTINMYLNGVSDQGALGNVNFLSSTDISNPASFQIGKLTGQDFPFIGAIIDEVRVYNQALTIGQIQKLYANGLEKYQNIAIR